MDQGLLEQLAEIERPFHERHQRVAARYNAWFQAECADPHASISTDPPDEVNARLARIDHERGVAVRAFVAKADAELRSDGRKALAKLEPLLRALVEGPMRRYFVAVSELRVSRKGLA